LQPLRLHGPGSAINWTADTPYVNELRILSPEFPDHVRATGGTGLAEIVIAAVAELEPAPPPGPHGARPAPLRF